ncbi:CENPA protein, partial [Paradoxornis webbianus]|nr:CENPA protein [Sinosuthora webbiana]
MPRPKPTPRRRGRPASPPPPSPRARRRRPGQRALQEIRRYQSSTRLLLRPGPFARLVRELCLLFTRGVDYHWQRMALLALQE